MSITSIVVANSPHPVLDNEKNNCSNYQPLNLQIWKQGSTTAIPCTVDLADANLQQILVYVTLPAGYDNELKLSGVLKDISIVKDTPQIVTSSNDGTCFTLTLAAPCTTAPWGYDGDVKWTLKDASKETDLEVTPIRIYGVSSYLPSFFQRKGLYAGFLEYFIPTNTTKTSNFIDYTKHVVGQVFNSGYVYDRVSGGQHYAALHWSTEEGHHDNDVHGSYDLRKWIRNRKLTDGPYHVNCYDQAGATQLALSLGILNKPQGEQLKMHFLAPFGYIKPTYLVGWTQEMCNSPYASYWHDQTVLSVTDKYRTHFGNHVFLIYDQTVLDATCQPKKQPDSQPWPSLSEYLAAAIDTDIKPPVTKKYHKGSKLPEEVQQKLDQGSDEVWTIDDTVYYIDPRFGKDSIGGTVHDIESGGPGITTLWRDEKIEDYLNTPGESKETHTSIQFNELSSKLSTAPTLANWLTVEPMSKPEAVKCATAMEWTLRSSEADGGRADLSILCYTTEAKADSAYEEYLAFTDDPGTRFIEASKDEAKKRRHAIGVVDGIGLHIWVVGRIFVELSGFKKSAALDPIVQVLDEYLTKTDDPSFKCCTNVTLTSLESTTGSEATPNKFKMNSKFEAKVSAPGAFAENVHNETGNVIFLESKKGDAEDAFIFRFVARRVGSEKISISFVDASCDPCCAQKVEFTVEVYE